MKRYRNTLMIIGLLLTACRKDYFPQTPPVDLSKPVSFATDILPIFSESCAISGCHNGGGQAPELTSANGYSQLMGLGYVDTANAEGSILYVRMISTNKPMPPAGKLSSDKISKIFAWIKQGAQNN